MKVIEMAFAGYPVTDLKRARHFYEGTLGLKPTKVFGNQDKAWVEYDIGPATLAIGNGAPDWKPTSNGGTVALEVEDFDMAVQDLKQAGASFQFEPIETPVCRMAAVLDPDGNPIIIHKRKA